MQSVHELETNGLVAGRAEQNARSDDTGAAEQLEKRLARRRDQARAKRQSETAENREQCSRLQIPLKLAWAVTIHKSQGLTLNKVVIDVGKKRFSCDYKPLLHLQESENYLIFCLVLLSLINDSVV